MKECWSCERGPYSCAAVPAIERQVHAYPPAQAHRCGRAHRPGGDLGAGRDGAGAIARRQEERADRGDLLRGRGPRLVAAGDAAGAVDVAPERHHGMSGIHAALTRRKPFQTAVAAPETSTRT